MKLLLEKTDIVELLQKVMDNFRLIAEEKILISACKQMKVNTLLDRSG